jgi:ABC-type amino acid transport substrate-binding protein
MEIMMSAKTFVILMAVCSLGGILSGCSTDGTATPGSEASRSKEDSRPILRVGITPDYAPLIFKRGDQIVGVEADFARALAAALGRRLHLVELTWEEQIPALNQGKTDIIMSGMSVTRARQVRVDFCESYLRNGLMAAVPADEAGRYLSRENVLNFSGRVGAVKSTTSEAFVRRGFPDADLISLTKPSHAAHFLRSNRIRMFINDVYAIVWLVSENEAELSGIWYPLTDEDLAWAVRRGEPEFSTAINDVLAGWRKDGTQKRILDHWVPHRDKIQWPPKTSKAQHE